MEVVVQFLQDLYLAVSAAPGHRSSDLRVNDVTDPERVEAVLKEAQQALARHACRGCELTQELLRTKDRCTKHGGPRR